MRIRPVGGGESGPYRRWALILSSPASCGRMFLVAVLGHQNLSFFLYILFETR